MLSVPVNSRNRFHTFTRSTKDDSHQVTRDPEAAFRLTGKSWIPEQNQFILWYSLTTNLNYESISNAFERTYRDRSMPASDVKEIAERLSTRYMDHYHDWGNFSEMLKPDADGWAPCDHGFPCEKSVSGRRRHVKKSASCNETQVHRRMAETFWKGSYEQLLTCPRKRHVVLPEVAKKRLVPESPALETVTKSKVLKASKTWFMQLLRTIMSCCIWLKLLDFYFSPLADDASDLDQYKVLLHTWYGLFIAVALTNSAIHLLRLSLDQIQARTNGSVMRAENRNPLAIFIYTFLAISYAVSICSYFGLIENLAKAQHPNQADEYKDFQEHWTLAAAALKQMLPKTVRPLGTTSIGQETPVSQITLTTPIMISTTLIGDAMMAETYSRGFWERVFNHRPAEYA